MNPYALLHVLLKCLMVLCETVSCVVHALPAEAEEESASASASQVLLFFVFCGRSSAAASNIKRSNGGDWLEAATGDSY